MRAAGDTDEFGRSGLHYASLQNGVDEVARLISAGADIDLRDKTGMTPLHMAAQEYAVDAARLLIEAGGSVAVTDAHGNAPLWTATFNSRGRGEVIALLLATGADPDAPNRHGVSPRELAQRVGNYDIVRFFPEGPGARPPEVGPTS